MPGPYLFPGVYVEEIPSGVRPITAVSTSNTAFVDFFARGPVDTPLRITSYSDFERAFGGLDTRSEASYAIQQYYLNGGSIAWVVRVAPGATPLQRTLQGPGGGSGGAGSSASLDVSAINPGKWGDSLQVAIDHQGVDADSFNMVVREVVKASGVFQVRQSETFRNLNLNTTSARFAERAINNVSTLIRVTAQAAGGRPNETGAAGPDVINQPQPINKTTGDATDFLWLGRDANSAAGSDGTEPGSDQWKNADGRAALIGSDGDPKTGMHALDRIAPDIFNLLCLPAAAALPNASMQGTLADAATYCEGKRAFLLVDIPPDKDTAAKMLTLKNDSMLPSTNHAAVYFPRLEIPDLLNQNRPRNVGPSGTLAGVYARTDATRGVWKAPAGTDASLRGASIPIKLTDKENGGLNPFGVNVLRHFPIFGPISWGARTLEGADQQASEWKYIPVRRMALFIEESLSQGLKWVVFEPNDEPLWAQIRLNVGSFMQTLFRQGAFQGKTPREAYLVKCDKETTTQADINLGIVNIVVGFAPLKPAEFVIIRIQQLAGQIEV